MGLAGILVGLAILVWFAFRGWAAIATVVLLHRARLPRLRLSMDAGANPVPRLV
jgi:hypothetical protein